jgi:hypothetical protein
VSTLVVREPCPALRVAEPITAAPSRKFTVPVGVPAGATPVTVAVKVTGVPEVAGFVEEVMLVLLVPVPVIVKLVKLVAVPPGVVTAMGPVVAPTGTTA